MVLIEWSQPFMRIKVVISCTSRTASIYIISRTFRFNPLSKNNTIYVSLSTSSAYHGEAHPGISHPFEMTELCCCNLCFASRLYVSHSVVSKHPSTSQVLGVNSWSRLICSLAEAERRHACKTIVIYFRWVQMFWLLWRGWSRSRRHCSPKKLHSSPGKSWV